jgi:DMSO/TMAO reductase YedYZ molybdopterin-dependent catalytic subunit
MKGESMSKINRKILFTLAISMLMLSACASIPKIDWQLSISGAVSNPLTVNYKELAKMPQTDLKDIFMDKSTGEDSVGSWSGVLLADLLTRSNAEGDYVSITAIAADGYAIEITRNELKNAIVALKEEGEWIQNSDTEHGPIRLVCPQTPANRWVFQLMEIQVNQ